MSQQIIKLFTLILEADDYIDEREDMAVGKVQAILKK
jgi:hypothetical protein